MGVGGQHHTPAALPPGKTRYPLYRRLGRHQGRSGRVRKISPPTGIRSPDRPARSESLYRLRYPGPLKEEEELINQLPWLLCSVVVSHHTFLWSFYVKGSVCSNRSRGVDRRPGEWNGQCSPSTAAFLCNRVATSASSYMLHVFIDEYDRRYIILRADIIVK